MRAKTGFDEDMCDAIYLKGELELEKGNKKKAFLYYMKAAQLGDPEAQNRVGVCYDTGEGVSKDEKLAMQWYKKARRNGADPGVCSNIASLYASLGNMRRAIHWWSEGFKAGDGDAGLDLAKFYLGAWAKPWLPSLDGLDPVKFSHALNKNKLKAKIVALLKSVKKARGVSIGAKEDAEWLLAKISAETHR